MFNRISLYLKRESKLIDKYKEEVNGYNRAAIIVLLMLELVVCLALSVVYMFNERMLGVCVVYSIAAVYSVASLIFVQRMKDMPVIVLSYGIYAVMVLMCVYSSTIITPESVSIRFLFFMTLLPVIILDKAWRMNLFAVVSALCYAALCIKFKEGNILYDELLNTGSGMLIAIGLGYFMRWHNMRFVQLLHDKAAKKYVDETTGLPNHRRLVKDLANRKRAPYVAVYIDVAELNHMTYFLGEKFDEKRLVSIGDCLSDPQVTEGMSFYCCYGRELIGIGDQLPDKGLFQRLGLIYRGITETYSRMTGRQANVHVAAALWREDLNYTLEKVKDTVEYAKSGKGNTVIIYDDMKDRIDRFWRVA